MCGFCAVFNYLCPTKPCPIADWLQKAQNTLAKRGPDDKGGWISENKSAGMAHRRLSIIDLSTAAAQPFVSHDGNFRIVFNGEIYNYKKLKNNLINRGYHFSSDSDTEVILNLYHADGIDSLKKLRGMFAFALWDERQKGMLLARDPLGIKPLYYSDNGSTIRAASQVKTILAAGEVDTAPEPAGHIGFFLFGYVPEPFTLYKGIRALPAGSAIWFKKNAEQPKFISYYDLPEQINHSIDINPKKFEYDNQTHLKSALYDSISHHMVSDVPVGLFLSSGLDSTAISKVACQFSDKPLQTFTLGFDQYRGTPSDEVVLAEKIANQLNCLQNTKWLKKVEFKSSLASFFTAMDQPSIDGANTYFISKYASETGLKVALSGLGGDELFGGYPSFYQIPKIMRFTRPLSGIGRQFRLLTAPMIKRFSSPKFAGLFEYGGTVGGAYLLRRGLFMPWELPNILDPDMVREGWKALNPVVNLNRQIEKLTDNFHRIFILESINYMRNQLLRDADWAGMAHSLEIRVPLVDTVLIEALAPLMAGFKTAGKLSLAHAAWDQVPSDLLMRPKTGFSFPITSWISNGKKAVEKGSGLRTWARIVYKEAQDHLPKS